MKSAQQHHRVPHTKDAPYALAQQARRSLTLDEQRFDVEKRKRWKGVNWKRYAPVTIQAHPEHKSTWFAPFLCVEKKLVVVISDRPEFPYRIYGHHVGFYGRHGYTILDFSEDTSCPLDATGWETRYGLVTQALTG